MPRALLLTSALILSISSWAAKKVPTVPILLPAISCENQLVTPVSPEIFILPEDEVTQTSLGQIPGNYGGPDRYLNPKYFINEYTEKLVAHRTEVVWHSNVDRYVVVTGHPSLGPSRLQQVPKRSGKIDLSHVRVGATFPGLVKAASDDLGILLVDKSMMKAEKVGERSMYPTMAPDLVIVTREGRELKELVLPHWDRVRQSIIAGAPEGLLLKYDNLQAQFTPDGHYLMVNLNLSTERMRKTGPISTFYAYIEQNWIGVWDMHSGKVVSEFRSTELDSLTDKEPEASKPFKNNISMDRLFRFRLMPDGELILARAVSQRFNGRASDIMVKTARLRPNQPLRRVFEVRAGKWRLRPDRKQYDLGTRGGIGKLQISHDGQHVMVDLTSLNEGQVLHIPIPTDDQVERLMNPAIE